MMQKLYANCLIKNFSQYFYNICILIIIIKNHKNINNTIIKNKFNNSIIRKSEFI